MCFSGWVDKDAALHKLKGIKDSAQPYRAFLLVFLKSNSKTLEGNCIRIKLKWAKKKVFKKWENLITKYYCLITYFYCFLVDHFEKGIEGVLTWCRRNSLA